MHPISFLLMAATWVFLVPALLLIPVSQRTHSMRQANLAVALAVLGLVCAVAGLAYVTIVTVGK